MRDSLSILNNRVRVRYRSLPLTRTHMHARLSFFVRSIFRFRDIRRVCCVSFLFFAFRTRATKTTRTVATEWVGNVRERGEREREDRDARVGAVAPRGAHVRVCAPGCPRSPYLHAGLCADNIFRSYVDKVYRVLLDFFFFLLCFLFVSLLCFAYSCVLSIVYVFAVAEARRVVGTGKHGRYHTYDC